MIAKYSTGLVVGKFCPLHLGHEMLIQRAIDTCRRVVVISYTKPEFPGSEQAQRETWLQARFPTVRTLVIDDSRLQALCHRVGCETKAIPHNEASDTEQRAFVSWLCTSVLKEHIDAVFTSENYGDGFAHALSLAQRAAGAPGSNVTHECVDRARTLVPISGSQIRRDPFRYRGFMSPSVYRSLIKRGCFLGGESSGKTTIASLLAQTFNTNWVPEYGRELWISKDGRLQMEDMLAIAVTQVQREEQLSETANRWLFCDTSPLTTLFYSLEMFGRAEDKLYELAKRSYAQIFLCAPDFLFVQDGTRRDSVFQKRQHEWYKTTLDASGIAYSELTGTVADRNAKAREALGKVDRC